MAKPYETGLRDQVIHHAMNCAIRDRQELLRAWLPTNVKAEEIDAGTKEIIADVNAEIRDFRKLAKSLLL